MTPDTSDRADGRVRELRGLTLQRLQSHDELVALLEGVVDDATAVILPSFSMSRYRNDDTAPDPPETALAVSVVTGSSSRRNLKEDVNLTVQVEHEFRANVRPSPGGVSLGVLPWHDRIADEISAVMTTQVAGWEAEGETGGTPEPLWDDDRNRYRSVKRFAIGGYGR